MGSSLRYLLPLLVSAVTLAAGSLQLTGSTLDLGGIAYWVSPTPVSQLDIDVNVWKVAKERSLELVPFSVVSAAEARALQSTLEEWTIRDDVWSSWFMTGLLVTNGDSISESSIKANGIQLILKNSNKRLPSGPYFLSPLTGKVYEAYRLYSDENQAFLYGIIPADNGTYKQLPAHTDGAHTSTIGVPSRLYFTPTPEKPLAGYRVAVKDIYDIAGLKTGCGSRAYYHLYPAKNVTAPAIQRLIDAGAIVVGKAKTSQFANGEIATDDWVDLHAPYNPRGDGYQDAGSSSTGPASALSSYDWLDLAVGSDTGGSMRNPAGACGLFGNRPSLGAITMDGVMPLSPAMDTAGIFSRDAALWAKVAKVWYQDFQDYNRYPSKLLFPVDAFKSSYTTNPPEAGSVDAVFDDFLRKLEGFLSVNRTEIDIHKLWAQTRPSNVVSPSFNDFLGATYGDLIQLDQIRLLADPFFKQYSAVNDGQVPFVNPASHSRWALGRTLPAGAHEEAMTNKTVFKSWIANVILKGGQPDTCSDAIMVYPQSSGVELYRNDYLEPPTAPFGWSFGRISNFAEVPDMVIPVGELAYDSNITQKTQYLPVTLSFLAAKGCDLMLFNLFRDLQEQGIISKVETGSRLF